MIKMKILKTLAPSGFQNCLKVPPNLRNVGYNVISWDNNLSGKGQRYVFLAELGPP
jgi:hypothetical protein